MFHFLSHNTYYLIWKYIKEAATNLIDFFGTHCLVMEKSEIYLTIDGQADE